MFEKRNDLLKFLSVAETGKISMAADRLGMTQPALSRVAVRLERQFGGRLFSFHVRFSLLNARLPRAPGESGIRRRGSTETDDALVWPYVDAPLSATGNFRNTGSLQSGAVVCPASQMRRCRPRARMVFADRIQIAFAGSKPCGYSWFFRPRLSDSCPCAVLRSRRTVRAMAFG